MEITIRQREYEKYLTILQILASLTNPSVAPFNRLRNRELEVFAILLYYYNDKYADIPKDKRNQLIFAYDTRVEICTLLGDVSIDTVYNVMMNLRKQGLITKKEIVAKYILPPTDHFKINFKDEK